MTMGTANTTSCTPRSTLADFYFWTDPSNGYVGQCETRQCLLPSSSLVSR